MTLQCDGSLKLEKLGGNERPHGGGSHRKHPTVAFGMKEDDLMGRGQGSLWGSEPWAFFIA